MLMRKVGTNTLTCAVTSIEAANAGLRFQLCFAFPLRMYDEPYGELTIRAVK